MKFGLRRAMIAGELDWNIQNIVDQIKYLPKFGYYSIDARLAIKWIR